MRAPARACDPRRVMRVEDVMTREVAVVRPETPLKEVASILAENGVSGLPVVDGDGQVLGVLSESDIVLRERGREGRRPGLLAWLTDWDRAALEAKLEAQTAGQAMTEPPVTVYVHAPVTRAAELM